MRYRGPPCCRRPSPTLPKLTLALLASIGGFPGPAPAQSEAVDAHVRQAMEKRHIPGLALAVIRDGRLVKTQGYGLATLEHQVPLNPRRVCHSGSVGKQFTATAVMLLVENGKIRLDDPIERHLGDVPAAWKPITVRQLLTPTSGIPDYGPDDIDLRKDYTEDELLRFAVSMPLDFPPGEKWSYSNTGYVVLGILVGKVAGRFYGDLLRERVFVPLGMETACIISEADIVQNRAAGYRLVKGELKNQEWVSPSLNTTADGSLYLTVLDLAKWDEALAKETVLASSSRGMIWQTARLNDGTSVPYGFGWLLNEIRGRRLLEHGGYWQGFSAHIARYVDDRLTVIVLANLADANVGRIAHDVAGLYDKNLEPVRHEAMTVAPEILERYVGRYAFTPMVALTIARDGGRLTAGFGDGEPFELLPESETEFFNDDQEVQAAFVQDREGAVTHLLWRDVVEIEAGRIEPP